MDGRGLGTELDARSVMARHAAWLEGALLAGVVGFLLWAGGEVVRTSYHGYLHATIGEAVRAEGLQPENPYHAGEALRYYTLYPWLGSWLGSLGMGTMVAFALLQVIAALLFGPALDALGRAIGLTWMGRRFAFGLAVLGFNAMGWLGWWIHPPMDAAVPVFASESMTFVGARLGWDARLQAFLPKFLNVSSFSIALPAMLWALAAAWRARFDQQPAWKILVPAGVALAINPLAGGFAGLVLLAWGTPRLLSGSMPERAAWIGAGVGACAIAAPFLLPAFQAAPQGLSLTGSVRFEHDGILNVLGPLWLLLPFAIVGQLSIGIRERTLAWLSAAVMAMVIAAFVQLPWGNEYKLVRLAGLFLALAGAACLSPTKRLRWVGAAFLLFALPTTLLVARSYLDWGKNGVAPALTQVEGQWVPRPEVAARGLPASVHAVLLQQARDEVLWMNPVHPGTAQARGLVQGNVLAPALGHPLFVDSPQIHNDRYEDLALRLAWSVGSANLTRVFGESRGNLMLQVLSDAGVSGLWQGNSLNSASRGLRDARAHLPERTFLVLTQAEFPFVEEALLAAGASQLAAEAGISLWRLEPWASAAN